MFYISVIHYSYYSNFFPKNKLNMKKEYMIPEIKVKEMIMESPINVISGGNAAIGEGSMGAGNAGAKMDVIEFILDQVQ